MPTIDSETLAELRLAGELVRLHEAQIRNALEQRRTYFVEAATDSLRAHKAGALTDPPEPGHVLLIDNAGLKQAALVFKEQAEACVKALTALNAATGDEYEYEIHWEVEW